MESFLSGPASGTDCSDEKSIARKLLPTCPSLLGHMATAHGPAEGRLLGRTYNLEFLREWILQVEGAVGLRGPGLIRPWRHRHPTWRRGACYLLLLCNVSNRRAAPTMPTSDDDRRDGMDHALPTREPTLTHIYLLVKKEKLIFISLKFPTWTRAATYVRGACECVMHLRCNTVHHKSHDIKVTLHILSDAVLVPNSRDTDCYY